MITDDTMYSLLTGVIDAINDRERIPSKLTVRRAASDQRQYARRAKRLSAFERKLVRDGADEIDFWRDYLVAERSELYLLFRDLAVQNGLSASDRAEQVENFNAGLPRINAHMVKGQPVIDEIPVFGCEQPEVALRAKIAHALLWLDGHARSVLKVRQCLKKGCGKLFLQRQGPGAGAGAPRKCCYTPGHTNAYNQAEYRRLRKIWEEILLSTTPATSFGRQPADVQRRLLKKYGAKAQQLARYRDARMKMAAKHN